MMMLPSFQVSNIGYHRRDDMDSDPHTHELSSQGNSVLRKTRIQ